MSQNDKIFSVSSTYIVDEDNTLYTLDGSQRTSTCIDYINDKFTLSKDTPNITITSKENGETPTGRCSLWEKEIFPF